MDYPVDIGKLPLGRAALLVTPVLLEARLRAVEKNDGIGRDAGLRTHGHLRRFRTVVVMHGPRVLRIGRIAINTGENSGRKDSGHRENQLAHQNCSSFRHYQS